MYYWETMSHLKEELCLFRQFSGKDNTSSLPTLIIKCTEIYFTSSGNMCIVHQFSSIHSLKNYKTCEKNVLHTKIYFCACNFSFKYFLLNKF